MEVLVHTKFKIELSENPEGNIARIFPENPKIMHLGAFCRIVRA